MVCGGYPKTNACYKIEGGNWTQSTPMNDARFHFTAMVMSPYQDRLSDILICFSYLLFKYSIVAFLNYVLRRRFTKYDLFYLNRTHQFFVFGDETAKSVEVLTKTGWITMAATLPEIIYVSCIVPIDDSTIMITAGNQGGESFSTKTIYYKPAVNSWVLGPELKFGRYGHGCGKISEDDQSPLFSIIVAGGENGYLLIQNI